MINVYNVQLNACLYFYHTFTNYLSHKFTVTCRAYITDTPNVAKKISQYRNTLRSFVLVIHHYMYMYFVFSYMFCFVLFSFLHVFFYAVKTLFIDLRLYRLLGPIGPTGIPFCFFLHFQIEFHSFVTSFIIMWLWKRHELFSLNYLFLISSRSEISSILKNGV